MDGVEAARASGRGPSTSDYADMSNEKPDGNSGRRNPKASRAGSSARGQSAPKARPKGVVDGQQVNIPARARRAQAQRRRRVVAGVNGYPLDARERAVRVPGSPGARRFPHASQKSAATPTCTPYQNRHRWEGTKIPRRAGETSLRNSAT